MESVDLYIKKHMPEVFSEENGMDEDKGESELNSGEYAQFLRRVFGDRSNMDAF